MKLPPKIEFDNRGERFEKREKILVTAYDPPKAEPRKWVSATQSQAP